MKTVSEIECYNQSIEQLHDAVIATDLDGAITYWNIAAERLFGYKSSEAVGQHISFVYFEEDYKFLEENIIELLKVRGHHDLNMRLQKKNSLPLYCHLSLSMLLNSTGSPVGMIGYTMDLTEKIFEEEKRIDSERKYKEIFDAVPVSIWEEDISELRVYFEKLKKQGVTNIKSYLSEHPDVAAFAMRCIKIRDVNNYTLKLYKVSSKNKLLNDPLAPFITTDAQKTFLSELVAIWNEENIFTAETTNKTSDGDIIYLNMMVRIPSVTEPNKPMLVCIQDLTVNKFTENALSISEEKYRSVVEATSEWIWEIDLDRHITYSNDAVSSILGYSTIEIFRTDLCQLMHDDDAAELKAAWPKIISEKETWNIKERRWLDREGNIYYLESVAFPIYDKNQKNIGYRGLERDITERKINSDLLNAAGKLAATGELSARIAHEINNPLAGIKNSFQLVKLAVDSNNKYFKYVELIDKEIDRITNIVRLMYGLYNNNEVTGKSFDLKNIVNEIIALIGNNKDKKIKYEINISNKACYLNYPEASFRQILFNFIGNAVDAYDSNGIIYINSKIEDGFLYFCVADNGRGIDEENISKIFEPFFSTKNFPGKGLGLGLSTCKDIIESLGGEIECISNEKYKTEFKITLAYKD